MKSEIEIRKGVEKADISINDQNLGKLNPQEIWDLSNELRDFVITNSASFAKLATRSVSCGNFDFQVLAGSHPEFWDLANRGEWEPTTYQVFDRFITRATTFLDVGAWIGSTALYGAQLARETHAFEPDPVAFSELKNNVAANSKTAWRPGLYLHQMAISNFSGAIDLGSRNAKGDSMSSTLLSDEVDSWKVPAQTIKEFVEFNGLEGRELFIKIDIEGGEYELIPSLKSFFSDNNVKVLISLHPEFLLQSIKDSMKGPLKAPRIRAKFHKLHRRLIASLPFENIEHADGRPINTKKQLAKALLLGNFIHEIVAY